jgi:hypothetical protein
MPKVRDVLRIKAGGLSKRKSNSLGTGQINAIGVDPPPVEGCCGELTRAV